MRISNDPEYLRVVMARAGESPEVVLEAAYGWYWAADTLAELGARCIWRTLWSGCCARRALRQPSSSSPRPHEVIPDGWVADFDAKSPNPPQAGEPTAVGASAAGQPERKIQVEAPVFQAVS